MYYFCTYFDHRFLSRGLALYQSLRRHCPAFKLWVLCMDHTCYDVLSQLDLPDVYLIALEDFERGDEELLKAKRNRTLVEYYFTCTPSLPLFVLNNFPEVDLVTYLDADLFFFANPALVYDEIADHSIAIIEHRFPAHLVGFERYGIYNVGWLSFRRDQHAFACLHWWRERCIEWCYDRLEDRRFADQKYLDEWPTRFQGVTILRHKGVNLAPWNLANYKIRSDRSCVWVDGQPLIFFHFQGFKQIKGCIYDPNIARYKANLPKRVLQSIYAPYIQTILEVTQQASPLFEKTSLQSELRGQGRSVSVPLYVARRLRRLLGTVGGILTRKYIFVLNNGRIM